MSEVNGKCRWKEYPCDKNSDPTSTAKLCTAHKFEAYQRWLMEKKRLSSLEARAYIEEA